MGTLRGIGIALAGFAVLTAVGCGGEEASQRAVSSTRPSSTTAVASSTTSVVPTTTSVAPTTTTPAPPTTRPVPTTTTQVPAPPPIVIVPTTTVAIPAPPQLEAPQPPRVSYSSCKEAKAAGAAPLHRGDPGYSRSLDRDGDGVACET